MVLDRGETQGRVTDEQYRELPEGHRTTLVVGMLDMLEVMAVYLGDKERGAFEPLLKYTRQFTSGDFREIFDNYVNEGPADRSYMIASSLLSMLIVKSGANLKISK